MTTQLAPGSNTVLYKTEAEASASTLSPTLLVSVYPHGAGVIILLVSVHPHTAGVMTLLVSVYPHGAGVSVSLCSPSCCRSLW